MKEERRPHDRIPDMRKIEYSQNGSIRGFIGRYIKDILSREIVGEGRREEKG